MTKKIARRTFLKTFVGALVSLVGALLGGFFYARNIEPRMLQIKYYKIKHKSIPKSFNQFKIVQFSDTHLGFQYTIHQLEELVFQINKLTPDLICFTGDLMDEPNKYKELNRIIPVLKKLKAPFGKFSIYGNHDHGGYGTNIYKNIMEQSDFTLLINEAKDIKLIDGSKIYVLGIDDAMLGDPNIDKAIKSTNTENFKILLSHAPDIADQSINYGIQLQLSGHSHGGQVRIPFLGAFITPPFAEKYHEGLYTIGNTKPLTLYVNRGLGTTRLPFRFLTLPELTVFTLMNED